MRILFHKFSNERHALELHRPGRPVERIECETRSFLIHDLLHYSVESSAGLQGGFWGNLAQGKTLSEMTANAAIEFADKGSELAQIERVVGPITGITKGIPAVEIFANMRAQAASMDADLPRWLSEDFVLKVQELMRQLLGRWNSTSFGNKLELEWPLRNRETES